MDADAKKYWPETVFKRLWWQGYKGQLGIYDWPNEMLPYYDTSEYNAWCCGVALLGRINQLNSRVHQVNVLAHSQGNVLVGGALRRASGQVLNTYVASQAAIAADCYQAGLPEYFAEYTTPNVFKVYPPTGSPYLSGALVGAGQVYSFYNADDYALHSAPFGSWEMNNQMKPNITYDYQDSDGDKNNYAWPNEYFLHYTIGASPLSFPRDCNEIFSFAAEARARALGVLSGVAGFSGFNLQSLNYGGESYSHSRQFRSNIIDEWEYWQELRKDCDF